jgi:hypothetical protein
LNRRRSARQPRRVQVQYWQPGEEIHRGFTTNVSETGVHIATPTPLPPAARVRVELSHNGQSFLVEGVVAHRRSVHPELARVATSGMGVRFLTPGELITELFPRSASKSGSATGEWRTSELPVESAPVPPPPLDDGRTFSVRFASVPAYLTTYQRDIVNGGLFVATARPAPVHEIVTIELQPPEGVGYPVLVEARVVQRFQPQRGSGAILVGMGVELVDLPGTLQRLQPVIDALKSHG